MDKDKILEKARASQKDEREQQIEMKSLQMGWLGVTVVIFLLILFRSYFGEFAADLLIILMTQFVVASFYQYKQKTKNKHMSLVAGITGIIALLLNLVALLTQYGVF